MKSKDKVLSIAIICVSVLLIIAMIKSSYNRHDVNRDGVVNAQDYVEIKNYIMNAEDR